MANKKDTRAKARSVSFIEMVSLSDKYLTAIRWLHLLAIRPRYTAVHGIMTVMVGHGCTICESNWRLDEQESHKENCPLFERKS